MWEDCILQSSKNMQNFFLPQAIKNFASFCTSNVCKIYSVRFTEILKKCKLHTIYFPYIVFDDGRRSSKADADARTL